MIRTRTTSYVTLLSVVLALALTAALAACGSDEPSGVTGPTGPRPPQGQGTRPLPPMRLRPAAAPTLGPTSAETDREALVAFYNATDGENWDDSENWLSDAPLGEWEGRHHQRRRARYRSDPPLQRRNASGEIPPELGSLSNLEWLLLPENALSGEIPAELGSLSNLVGLGLSSNDLSGEIPPELGSLSNLEWLNLTQRLERGDTGGAGQPLQPDRAVPRWQPVERVCAEQPERPVAESLSLAPALLLKPRALSRGRTAYRPEGAQRVLAMAHGESRKTGAPNSSAVPDD